MNGTYYCTDETRNSKAVYVKGGDVDSLIYYATDGKWYVTDTADKEANECSGYAHTEAGLATPIAAKAWQVCVDEEFVAQALKTATMVANLFFLALTPLSPSSVE